MLREIVPGVLTWAWPSPRHPYDFNGFLVRDPGGTLCIDPVEPGEGDLDAIVHEGVARVLLTNRNHVRSAELVRERTGAPIAIHPADAAYARGQGATIAGELNDGQRCGNRRARSRSTGRSAGCSSSATRSSAILLDA